MLTLLAALIVLPAQGTTLTTGVPKQPPARAGTEVFAEAEPDVVLRGRSVKLVVRGRDTASLKTLQLSPPDGVTMGPITPLPSRSDGSAAVSVELQVDAAAQPGERALLLTITPTIMTSSGTRSGGDSASKAMDALLATVTKDQTETSEVGTLYINSHDIAIAGVAVSRDQPHEVHIMVTDARNDLEEATPAGASAAPATGIVQLRFSDLIVSEVVCGRNVFHDILEDAMVRQTRPGTAVIVAMLDATPLKGAGACSLKVRVRDAAGNTSPWFTTKLDPR